jgi:hypothetical protein
MRGLQPADLQHAVLHDGSGWRLGSGVNVLVLWFGKPPVQQPKPVRWRSPMPGVFGHCLHPAAVLFWYSTVVRAERAIEVCIVGMC